MAAFQLTDAFTGMEPITFPGFPGTWVPGEPQDTSTLVGGPGLDTEDAVARLLRDNPHLKQVKAKPKGDS